MPATLSDQLKADSLIGAWPLLLRRYALTAGETEAVELARLLAGWKAAWEEQAGAELLKWQASEASPSGPPPGVGYHWVGVRYGSVNTKTGRPRVKVLGGYCDPGHTQPAGATMWATPGGAGWTRFKTVIEAKGKAEED